MNEKDVKNIIIIDMIVFIYKDFDSGSKQIWLL